MQTVQAVIMGAVQGLSEFLPISSSAHLVFSSSLYKLFTGQVLDLSTNQEVFFDIMIHLATLFAVFIYFGKDIKKICVSFINSVKTRNFEAEDSKLVIYIFIGTIFTCILALLFKGTAEELVSDPKIVSLLLILTGFILFISEFLPKWLKENKKDINIKNSILIGIAQGLAVFPGLSRSGLTIATGVACGVERVKAARYSFLLSIPIILGASMIYPLVEIDLKEAATYNWTAIIAGFLTALITGYFCIKYFMRFLSKYSLRGFAYYCWAVGLIMFLLFSLQGTPA